MHGVAEGLVEGGLSGEPGEEREELRARVVRVEGGAGVGGERDDPIEDDRAEQGLPVREVSVHGADPDAGRAGDRVERHGRAVGGEQLAGGVEHEFPVPDRAGPMGGEARQAIDLDADVIVARGTESGGHGAARGRCTLPFVPFVPVVVDLAGPIPVPAAGVIAEGRGIAAASALDAPR